ncbi:MAG: glycosyltransferase family 4 protein [Bdellovibrionales bacterium]|nr:glycosyltransferase family 4 protein [Bdellovibrionales bacterium]
MKILLDARMVGPQMHGIARYTLTIANLLRNHGHEVSLLVSDSGKSFLLASSDWDFVISSVPFAHPLEPFLLMKHQTDFKRFDVVHFTSFATPIVPPKNSVVTIHDLIHLRSGSPLKKLYYRLFLRFSLRVAKQLISVSQWTKTDLVQLMGIPEGRVSVVGNFLDEAWFRSTVSAFENSKSYFLSVANEKPHKNVITLIKACQALWEKGLDFDLFLVGSKMDAFLEGQGGLHPFTHRIRFFSKISDDELRSLYRGAKAFISTSLMEGYNLPVVEALSQSCPVILSKAEAHLEFSSPLLSFYGQAMDSVSLAREIEARLGSPRDSSGFQLSVRNQSEVTFQALQKVYGKVSKKPLLLS